MSKFLERIKESRSNRTERKAWSQPAPVFEAPMNPEDFDIAVGKLAQSIRAQLPESELWHLRKEIAPFVDEELRKMRAQDRSTPLLAEQSFLNKVVDHGLQSYVRKKLSTAKPGTNYIDEDGILRNAEAPQESISHIYNFVREHVTRNPATTKDIVQDVLAQTQKEQSTLIA